MNIIDIKQSGCDHILNWSISQGAEIYNDLGLQAIVNDEMFYLITISDINFLELFRLSQMYREKLRIIKEEKADVPPRSLLMKLFNGTIVTGKGTENEKSLSMAEATEYVCQNFLNLILQMQNDSDIISPTALRLFLPMITRKFTVQIPYGFADFIKSITKDESSEIFNKNYPNTLSSIIENPEHNFHKIFNLGFIKATDIIRYDKQYDKYLNVFRYQSLRPTKDNINELYRVALSGFHCFDKLSRGEIRCSLFNSSKESLTKTMTNLKFIDFSSDPLYFDFAIELPIQYMMILCNTFSNEVLTISNESSMVTILNGGIEFNDFIMPEYTNESELTEDQQKEVENTKNSIDAYRIRITEANQLLMNTLEAILSDEKVDVSISDAFSMLPCIYRAKASITVNSILIDKYPNHSDSIISKMFKEIRDIATSIIAEIKSMPTK